MGPDQINSTAVSPVLTVRNVTKWYGDVLANDGINLEVRPGEILALLGENGAGKSTLVRILAGLTAPNDGEVLVAGQELSFGDPGSARRLGIGVVHQHFMLVPDMTATENVALSRGRDQPLQLDLDDMRERILELGQRHGLPVRPDELVHRMPVGERQRIEILKCLLGDARVLLLDEPSAVLSPTEWDQLAAVLRQLASEGMGVVLITHKLGEIASVADRCSVIRDGRVVSTVEVEASSPEELARLMVGREVVLRTERPAPRLGPVVLDVNGLVLRRYRGNRDLGPIDLQIRAGEILGVAGVEGNGQTELADLLAGQRTPTSGVVTVKSEGGRPGRIGVIAEDRHKDGLALPLSVEDNLMLRAVSERRFSKWGIQLARAIREHCADLVQRYHVRTRSIDTIVAQLSGGNQQKVVLARELHHRPDLLIASQPTRGLDVGAIEFVHAQINAHKKAGGSTVLFSAELDEIFALSDRIAVMASGRLVAVLDAATATRERVGHLMASAGIPNDEGEPV